MNSDDGVVLFVPFTSKLILFPVAALKVHEALLLLSRLTLVSKDGQQ